jgi:spore germination protein YaaH
MNRIIGILVLIGSVIPNGQRPSPRPELWAFTGPWDPRSDSSLRANAARIDVAITGWIGLDSATALPIDPPLFRDTIHLTGAARRMAIVTSWHGDRFHPNSIRLLARDGARLTRAAGAIAAHAAAMRYAGLVLDFEGLERADIGALTRVVKTIADSARGRAIPTIVVAIPAADTIAYPAAPIAEVADFVLPMLYDQHWSTSGPGPISEPGWVRSVLARRIAEVGASRIVAALPVYGYRWRAAPPAEAVSFVDAQRIAAQSRVPLERDAGSSTLRAVKPGDWEIWVTDAELLATLWRQAAEAGVRRMALWRIGQEDPGIWRSLGR